VNAGTARSITQPGDLAQLVGSTHKNFIIRLENGAELQTHRGILKHDDLIGLTWGSQVFSHTGNSFFLLQPSLADLLRGTRRNTQILYPKDIGFILVTLGIGPGQHVLECGTGSGAMTTALSFAVGPQGHVTTYEMRPEMQALAKKNLARAGLEDRVTFKLANIAEGIDEREVDAIFYDLPNPEDYIRQARMALKSGGFFGCILPTTNQVTRLISALKQEDFAFIEVCETMLRYYKPVADRLRPVDRMVAHTGYLIFSRPIVASDKVPDGELFEEPPEDVQPFDGD
jgi:tRNA (adenine57-N1/adenine58-N1)-methyltransferase catalytic subunit